MGNIFNLICIRDFYCVLYLCTDVPYMFHSEFGLAQFQDYATQTLESYFGRQTLDCTTLDIMQNICKPSAIIVYPINATILKQMAFM